MDPKDSTAVFLKCLTSLPGKTFLRSRHSALMKCLCNDWLGFAAPFSHPLSSHAHLNLQESHSFTHTHTHCLNSVKVGHTTQTTCFLNPKPSSAAAFSRFMALLRGPSHHLDSLARRRAGHVLPDMLNYSESFHLRAQMLPVCYPQLKGLLKQPGAG